MLSQFQTIRKCKNVKLLVYLYFNILQKPKFSYEIQKYKENQEKMKQIHFQKYDLSNQPLSPYPYKEILIAFMIFKYFWEQYINLRQISRHLIKDIPQDLRGYNIRINDFILGQSYSFDKMAYQMLYLSIKMSVDCMCIMCNIWAFIWQNVNEIFPFVDMSSQIQRAIGYILIQGFIRQAFYVPFSAYQTFIIQKKYGFTNKTLQTFIKDLFSDGLCSVIIFPPVLIGYLRVVQWGGEYFYLVLQIFAFCVTILLGWVHPNLIAPLFNEFKQLSNQGVVSHLNHLAEKVKFPLKKILWMNGSVRSAHSNAYFYGFGRTKVIVLYDTLLAKLNQKEITSVVCHQLGHWAYSHSFKKLVVYLVEVLSISYIFSVFLQNDEVFLSFGFKDKSIFIGSALVYHLFQPITSIFDVLLLVLTRKFQFQADIFACQNGYGKQLKSSLIKIFQQSTAMVKPDWLYAWIKHSHPIVHQRVQQINQYQQKRRSIQQQWQSDSYSSKSD